MQKKIIAYFSWDKLSSRFPEGDGSMPCIDEEANGIEGLNRDAEGGGGWDAVRDVGSGAWLSLPMESAIDGRQSGDRVEGL